jgi:hypothetical protein
MGATPRFRTADVFEPATAGQPQRPTKAKEQVERLAADQFGFLPALSQIKKFQPTQHRNLT